MSKIQNFSFLNPFGPTGPFLAPPKKRILKLFNAHFLPFKCCFDIILGDDKM